MAWFDETCINSDNIDMNDCRRINCVAPLHCTCMEGTVIDMIGGCNLNHLKMNHKTSPLGFLGFMYLLFWPSKHISLNVPSALLKSLHKATIFNIFTFYIGSFYIGKGVTCVAKPTENHPQSSQPHPQALWRFYGPQLYCFSSLSRLSSVIFRYSWYCFSTLCWRMPRDWWCSSNITVVILCNMHISQNKKRIILKYANMLSNHITLPLIWNVT